jgi:hypothetical protein
MNDLISEGARTKVVMALTGATEKRVRAAAKDLIGSDEKRGPYPFPEAKTLVGMGSRRNNNANLLSTRFLTLYNELEQKFNEPMHEGFLLLAAYRCYEQSVAAHRIPPSQEHIDLNRGYALLRAYKAKEIELQKCATCEAPYIRLNWYECDDNACPICSKVAHKRRLTERGRKGGRGSSHQVDGEEQKKRQA